MDGPPPEEQRGSRREQALFAAALQRPPEARGAFLDDACQGDRVLRTRLEALLAAHDQPDTALADDALGAGGRDPVLRAADQTVGQTIDRYQVLGKIGEGGCGIVYVAEQTEPVRRQVALKVIKPGMDSRQVVARFEAERQALAMMDHPHIARVFDAGTTGQGLPYFVMELVRGLRITDYCDQHNISTVGRLDLFIAVCQAVQHAHQKGIIHRDIKPSNVLVTLTDGAPVPKVIDFGIAKATEGRLTEATIRTQFHQFIGTPAYMSPEQAEQGGLDIDTRSDIYSLGVLLYELLTGRPPFEVGELLSHGLDAMRRTIREQEPAKPSTKLAALAREDQTTTARRRSVDTGRLLRLLQGDLDWIVMKCLEKDRTRRYETANGLAADLKRHLENEPVVARPPSTIYRLRKAWRRNQVVCTAGALVILALAVGLTLAIIAFHRASVAQAGEAEQRELATQRALDAEAARSDAVAAAAAENRERKRAENLLEQTQLRRAAELLERRQTVGGAAQLVQVLRANPSNTVAAARLVAALVRSLPQPSGGPLRHDVAVVSTRFNPDGHRVVTITETGSAQVWDTRTSAPLTASLPHEQKVNMAEFSPDSLRVVTASADGTARIWNVRTGQASTGPMQHEREVTFARFSPDGGQVLTGTIDGSVRIWDGRDGQPLGGAWSIEGRVLTARFVAGGWRVAGTSGDTAARVWDAASQAPLAGPLAHAQEVRSAQFSPDGGRVVTASEDGTARIWDTRSGHPLTAPLQHAKPVRGAWFSPDGLRLVTASSDRTARIWDARTGQPLGEPLQHDATVRWAAFSPDGRRVATASTDHTARVWDARTGRPLTEPLQHEWYVAMAEFSPDGSRVLTACYDGTARLWDVGFLPPVAPALDHGSFLKAARFSPDGALVVTASYDRTARVWDARTGRPVTGPLHHEEGVNGAAFSPDSQLVATASADRTARIWDARTGRPVTDPLRHDGAVWSVAFSPDGTRMITGSGDGTKPFWTVRIWDVASGRLLVESLRHEGIVWSVAFSPDGLQIVTGGDDGTARIWDARSGQPLTDPLRHEAPVWSARFSPDGTRVVTASEDHTVRIWDATSGLPVAEPLRHDNVVLSARFSPDGRRVVTASLDRTARLWDAETGRLIREPLRHEGTVWSAEFGPDGRSVVTASEDGTARIWDVDSGLSLGEPVRHSGGVKTAAFSPDGRWVVTASGDGTALVSEVWLPGVPVPPWFLDWAEVRLGRRASDGTEISVIPADERQRVEQAVAARTGTDDFTRLAQWIQADPARRTLSPHSSLTVAEYVGDQIAANTQSSLMKALDLTPTNSLAWARLSLLLLDQDSAMHPDRLVEAEFAARRALELDPRNEEALRGLEAVRLETARSP
ncbi:MAG: protein kinase [Verrucomicrobiales bacterium]|nr:protein kinase [Verrucomicrobiales bacterium]